MTSRLRTLAAVLLIAAFFAPTLHADVLSVDITERRPLADGRQFGDVGPYEEILGKITFAIDPTDSRNQVIMNLDRAPTNAQGMVEATADLIILTPADAQRGNGVALVDIANRGRLRALSFNCGGIGQFGDGFLMKEGYTVVWVGWEFDVPTERPIQIEVPSVEGFPVGGLGFAARPRHSLVDQARLRGPGPRRAPGLVRNVAERAVSQDVPLSGVQHR